jgi:hypothetical protein
MEIRRQVVGESTITTEDIKKEFVSKNVTRQIIERKTVKAIELDCGHKISCANFNKVPTKNTRCCECETKQGNE